ncbi:hypothetical protein [Janthinobacterium sp. NKUCC06_STL]|uniref:hypothetical protein n=1 Tax=Janthinobacterium sp. NKUCC06_STL TaxID=2842127 RepID=UPI001C5A8257|nr:hypothetical protein [Janthinobacterium sp. NKUCC06_STL]MBW3510608.1 hypothetical protein [Janthinobacterium sp. NKUCC06_STL]
MKQPTKPSTCAIALANAPALLNWYKLFKDLTEQFVASEFGAQLLIAAALHVHPIYTWDIWSILGKSLFGG